MAIPNINDIIEEYAKLIPYQWVNSPNASGTIRLHIRQKLKSLLANQINDAFNLSTAVGEQLDVIGAYIGIPRIVDSLDYGLPFFELAPYVDPSPPVDGYIGYTEYTGSNNIGSIFRRYSSSDAALTRLDDELYRQLLEFKIVLNKSNNTLGETKRILRQFFGTDIRVIDNGNMSISYIATTRREPFITAALGLGLLPRPMGVKIEDITFTEWPMGVLQVTSYDNPDILGLGLNDYATDWNNVHLLSYNDD